MSWRLGAQCLLSLLKQGASEVSSYDAAVSKLIAVEGSTSMPDPGGEDHK